MSMITIKEYRHLTNFSSKCVERLDIPATHTKKAAKAFLEASESLRQSGLRGDVSVFLDGVFCDLVYIDEQCRLQLTISK